MTVPSLYSLVLAEPSFKKKLTLLHDRAQKELRQRTFPIFQDVLGTSLSVSFPSQVGLAMYDIEVSETRLFVGKACAVENNLGNTRYGMVKVLLLDSPLEIAVEGKWDINRLEVVRDGVLVGKTERDHDHPSKYKVSSKNGDANIQFSDRKARLEGSGEIFAYGLQLDTNDISNVFQVFSKRVHPNTSIVYDPKIKFCDPLVVMGCLLAARMLYHRSDFL